MSDMVIDRFVPSESAIDREIEALVGKSVRGELTQEDSIKLERLIARRGRQMRPSSGKGGYSVRRLAYR